MTARRATSARWAAAVVTGALALAGCTASTDGGEAASDDGLEDYYAQDLAFGSCDGFAPVGVDEAVLAPPVECGWLTVPLDYDDPSGRTARLAVSRLAATGSEADRIGSLVLNPGGPGGSGTVLTAPVVAGWSETPVPQRFDVIGLDPRGVGASEPSIRCFTDAEQDAGDNATTLLGTAGEWSAEDTEALVERCADGSGGRDVLAAVGTRDAARDLDVLRAALGDSQLTFAGQSYGTRLGAVYAEMFPGNVRAMVLDAAVDPTAGTAERRIDLHRAFQRSFDLLAEDCAPQPGCPLGPDPAEATAVFQELVRPLLDEPVPAGDGREVGFDQAVGAVTAALYDSAAWPAIIAGLTELATEGRGDVFLEINDLFAGRSEDGGWTNQTEANYAINCNDEQRRTPQEEAQLRRDIDEASPFMASGRDHDGVSRDACEAWPAGPTLGFPYAERPDDLVETLVVSVTGDPVTPHEGALALAESLGGSLLTVEGEVHTIAQSGLSPCVNDVVAEYLTTAVVPEGELTCSL